MAGARHSTGVSEPGGRVPGAPRGATWSPTIDFHAPLAFWFFWACQKNSGFHGKGRCALEGPHADSADSADYTQI